MRFEYEGRALWYATPDAPAPDGAVQAGTEITITVGVSPVDASNKVELLYRVNRGPLQMVAAKWLLNDLSGKSQYFGAHLAAFRAGDIVEYLPICRCAGRQVPSREEAQQFASSFRVTEAGANVAPGLAEGEPLPRKSEKLIASSEAASPFKAVPKQPVASPQWDVPYHKKTGQSSRFIISQERQNQAVASLLGAEDLLKNEIEARLRKPFVSQIDRLFAGDPDGRLASMARQVIGEVDLLAAGELNIGQLLGKQLSPIVRQDEDLGRELRERAEAIREARPIRGTLQLDLKLKDHPLLRDLILRSHLAELLLLSPLGKDPARVDVVIEALETEARPGPRAQTHMRDERFPLKLDQETLQGIEALFELWDLTVQHIELVKVLHRRRIKTLLALERDDWLRLFKEESINPPDRFAKADDPASAYANFLLDAMEERFPSAAFLHRFNRSPYSKIENYREDLHLMACRLKDEGEPDEAKVHLSQLGQAPRQIAGGVLNRFTRNRGKEQSVHPEQSLGKVRELARFYAGLGIEQILSNAEMEPALKVERIERLVGKLHRFFDDNPDLDLINSDFHSGILVPTHSRGDVRRSMALLTLDAGRYEKLQEGPVPKALRTAFEGEAGSTLSTESKVTTTKAGWRIRDDANNRAYRVRSQDGTLRVYQEIDWSGLGEDKETIARQLKTYQRLLRVRPRFETVERLLVNGYTSAIQIARQPMETILDLFQDDQELGRRVYGHALRVTERSTLTWINSREIAGASTLRDPLFENTAEDLVQYIKDIPGFHELFELPRFCDCKDCRSIFGPAAYFVDLMGFIDEHVTDPERRRRQMSQGNIPPGALLPERRPDLWQIPLDCDHANRTVPYLDLVNAVLERRIEGPLGVSDPYQTLATARHPFNLPFNLPLAQIRLYLRHFKTTLHDLLGAFGESGQPLAYEYLGLSKEAHNVITTSPAFANLANQLASAYGVAQPTPTFHLGAPNLPPNDLWGLRRVETFLRHTGLSKPELVDLVNQNLDQAERNRNVQASFYINQARDGNIFPAGALGIETVSSDPSDVHEVLRNLTAQKLDRLHRFVRLARTIGWSFEDLDWALRSIGKNALGQDINSDAIRDLYRIKRWQDQLKTPLDVLCSFWYTVKHIGRQNLADRVFNNLQVLAGASPYNFAPPAAAWDKQDPDDPERGRLLASLEVTDQELDQLGAAIPANQVPLNLDNLSTLYRLSKLPKVLDLTIADFFNLLDLLGIVPGQITGFDNLDRVIMMVQWLKAARWRVHELRYMVTGQVNEFVARGYDEIEIRLWLEELASASVTIVSTDFAELAGVSEDQSIFVFNKLVQDGFIAADASGAGGKLTSNFDPDTPGFTLGPLDPPFPANEEAAREQDIIGFLMRKRDEQKQVVLEKLALFFDRAPALIRSILPFAALSLDDLQTLHEFYAGIPSAIATDETLPVSQAASDFLANLHHATFIADQLDLSQVEIALLTTHPEYFNISDPRNLTMEDFKRLYEYKHLARSLPDPAGLLAFFDLNAQTIDNNYFVGIQLASNAQVTQDQSATLFNELVNNGLIQKADPTDSYGRLTPTFTPYAQGFTLQPLSAPFDDSAEAVKPLARLKQAKNELLAALFRTDTGEIELLAQRHRGLSTLDDLITLKKQVDLSLHLGAPVELLLTLVNIHAANWAGQTRLAQALLELFKAKHGEDKWAEQFEPFQDLLREQKRDALAAYIIGQERGRGLETLDDLYQFLLIDVQMSSQANDISPIREGLLAAQLYVERCLMNLEIGVPPESIPRKQWAWMKNYRVWEANRKVFLYPENYILPELRDDKSSIFKELEDELLQAEVSDPAVEKVYRNYLDKFAELANLRIAGSYYHADPETNMGTLYLVGRTATTPYTYYYRKYISPLAPEDDSTLPPEDGECRPGRNETWTPWEKINLKIKADYASPIFAFKRLFLFWVEHFKRQKTDIQGGSITESSDIHEANILYSFYSFNNEWIQPQTLRKDVSLPLKGYGERRDRYWERAYPALKGSVIQHLHWTAFVEIGADGSELYTTGFDLTNLFNNYRTETQRLFSSGPRERFYALVNPNDTSNLREIVMDISRDNHYNEATLYLTGNPSNYILAGTLLANTSPQHAVSEVVNSKPDFFIFDNGDETFLVKQLANTSALEEYERRRTELEAMGLDYVGSPPPPELYTFERLSTHIVHDLSLRLLAGGLEGLLSIESQQLRELPFDRLLPDATLVIAPTSEQLAFEGSYGNYYREIFFHTPFLIAAQLNTNQRFEEAQKWFHYIFDPTATVPANTQLVHENDRYWQYLPFRNQTLCSLQRMLTDEAALRAYREDPFQPHAIARLRVGTYQKAVVMKYIDNLIDWAEHLFTLDSWESINEATLLYVLAYNILGGQPLPELEPCEIPPTQTYQDIYDKYGSGVDIPDFWIEVENASFGNLLFSSIRPTVNGFSSTDGTLNLDDLPFEILVPPSLLYFCVPENGQLRDYEQRVQDGLYKIRHGLNIEGVRRELPLYEPPIDPLALVRAVAGGRDISSVLSEVLRPLPHYRFTYLIDRARNLTAQVQQFGAALLAALEKQDAEELTLRRAGHEQALLNEVKKSREKQRDEAEKNLEALKISELSITTRRNHYQKLLDSRLSRHEQQHLDSMILSWVFENYGNIINTAASIGYAVPQAGSPFAITYGGQQIGAAFTGVAQAFRSLASFYSLAGSMSATLGGYERRRQEWELQRDLAQHDLDQIKPQLAAAELRLEIARQELATHEKQIEQSEEIERFLRDKFTNRDLYRWMAGQLSGLYFQAYKIAYDLAKSAEKAFQYERNTDDSYIQFGYWDSLKKGLLAGERLSHDLTQMEVAYLDQYKREYEITKHVSLAQLDPLALLQLKQTGECFVSLPEVLFDLDYPGHYMRRIKNVSLSIPAVIGPYTGVPCTLSLLRSSVRRTNTLLTTSGQYARDLQNNDPQNNDPRFTDSFGAIQSIVTSSGQNDSGLFDTNLRDERYLPFEGAGAISQWRIELPSPMRQFDYDTISDVILHLRYTAREGGGLLKQQAISELQTAIDAIVLAENERGLARLFSVRHEFPDRWHQFLHPASATGNQTLKLPLGKERFPFIFQGKSITIDKIELFVKTTLNQSMLKLTLAAGESAPPTSDDPQVDDDILPLALWNGVLRTAKSPVGQPGTLTMNAWIDRGPRFEAAAMEDILIICHYTVA